MDTAFGNCGHCSHCIVYGAVSFAVIKGLIRSTAAKRAGFIIKCGRAAMSRGYQIFFICRLLKGMLTNKGIGLFYLIKLLIIINCIIYVQNKITVLIYEAENRKSRGKRRGKDLPGASGYCIIFIYLIVG